MDKLLSAILAATGRLEEQNVGLRRDINQMQEHTTNILSLHARKINGLEKSRSQAIGWVKGLGVVSVFSGIIAFFKWGG